MQDSELLRAYREDRDERAFAELVRRYLGLVYASALRRLEGNSGLAEEVSQKVFLLLAKKARALRNQTTLAGWLHRTTRHVAANVLRCEVRRRARETKAIWMNPEEREQSGPEEILPLLDEALDALSESDRRTILLRFFFKKPMREVGASLGIGEDAAKMRVSRAVERLRQFFNKRGIACSSSGLAFVLSDQLVSAAPAHLFGKVMSGLASLGGRAASVSCATQIILLMSKTKAVLVGALACAGLFIGAAYHLRSTVPGSAPLDSVQSRTAPPGSVPQPSSPAPGQTLHTAALKASADFGEEEAATRRLRAVMAAPVPKSGIVWPREEVIQALSAFKDKRAALNELKEIFEHPDQLANAGLDAGDTATIRTRAIMSIGQLAAEVDEVKPFLQELLRAEDQLTKANAFSALKILGYKTEDLPRLLELLSAPGQSPALRNFVPEEISRLILQDRAGAASSVSALEALLEHPDEKIRFSAANSLTAAQLDRNPRIAEILSQGLRSSDQTTQRLSAEALGRSGAKASPFVPDLIELGRATEDGFFKKAIWEAVGAIQPELARQLPEVSEALSGKATSRELGLKLEQGTASMDDLIAALRLPQYASTAASRLADLGRNARSALPALLRSLEGKDEDQRERIVESIQRIDPMVKIEKVDGRTVMHALMEAEITWGEKANDHRDPLTQLLQAHRMYETWWTAEEVRSFAKQLAGMDTRVRDAFVGKLAGSVPGLDQP